MPKTDPMIIHIMRVGSAALLLSVLLSFLLLQSFQAAPAGDQMQINIANYTGHRWYSGYLTFITGNFHYVFFDSQTDPDNDPLVLWLNGGPGCSSLIGMVYENGPFVFKENTTQFELNPFSWNKQANLLYLESPGGVGFSQDRRGLNNNDGTTAEDNYLALVEFFLKFPNMLKNSLYLTGESYAGIYIPYLANEIIRRNKLPSRQFTINLKGIMIGNACTDPRECYEPGNDVNLGIFQYEFLQNHGYLTEYEWQRIEGACWLGYTSDGCKEVRAEVDKKFYASKTSMLNIYAKCMNQRVTAGTEPRLMINGQTVQPGADAISCQDSLGIQSFFNNPLNQLDFHVKNIRYNECSDAVGAKYKMFANASYWIYPLLIREKLRVWIYEGDVDLSVPITGTMRWITRLREEFGLAILEPWRQWWVQGAHKHEDQVGGMTWKLKGFTFASVRGAGHLVPKDKRKQAGVLLNAFLTNTDLPFKAT